MYFKFEEFINEAEVNNSTLHVMHPGNSHHSYGNPAYQVKLLGMYDAKKRSEQGNSYRDTEPKIELHKGDEIDVFSLKKEKTVKGRFISGQKNKKGIYSKITIIDDEGNLQELKAGHTIKR